MGVQKTYKRYSQIITNVFLKSMTDITTPPPELPEEEKTELKKILSVFIGEVIRGLGGLKYVDWDDETLSPLYSHISLKYQEWTEKGRTHALNEANAMINGALVGAREQKKTIERFDKKFNPSFEKSEYDKGVEKGKAMEREQIRKIAKGNDCASCNLEERIIEAVSF